MKRILLLLILVMSLAICDAAMADNVPRQGANADIALGGGYSHSFNEKRNGLGYLIDTSYQFTPYIGVGIGIMGVSVANNFNTAFNASISGAAATYIATNLYAPFGHNWRGFLRLGVGHASYLNQGLNIFKHNFGEGTAFIAGAGVAYFLTQRIALKGFVQSAMYEHSFTIYGLGISYHF